MLDFLKQHLKAMEPRYLHLNWNHIPVMYCQKNYLCSLVIKQEEWDHLSDPTYLAYYWEPTQEPGDFYHTFALVLWQSKYSDCKDVSHREEYVVLVAIIPNPACLAGIAFALVADEFSDPNERESTLLVVCLHRQSKLFPDIYFDQYSNHFTMMYISREHYNVGHPQKYVGTLIHNPYEAGGDSNSRKQNCLRPTWTAPCTNFQWIPVCGHTKIG